MRRFSERKGLKPIRTEWQIDSVDEALRSRLWNLLCIYYWEEVPENWLPNHSDLRKLVHRLWHSYFFQPTDRINDRWTDTYEAIRKSYFLCQSYEVYDFIEFVAKAYTDPYDYKATKFRKACNDTLEADLSAYRFVGEEIAQITSPEEIQAIEQAIQPSGKWNPVSTHLRQSLKLLADRKNPDYRNSIKESVSAVESLCKLATGNSKATLGDVLKKMGVHPALQVGFSKIYGYTSDADGIRHALMDEPQVSYGDAKLMLVLCSAFTNYIIARSAKAEMKSSP